MLNSALYRVFDRVISGSLSLAEASKMQNVSEEMFSLGLDVYEEHVKAGSPQKGFNTIEEAIKKAMSNQERKKRNYLTPDKKLDVAKALRSGGKVGAVAVRFGISEPTVRKICTDYAGLMGDVEKPVEPAPAPVEQYLEGLDKAGIYIDGDYIIFRIPRQKITRELLRGVLGPEGT